MVRGVPWSIHWVEVPAARMRERESSQLVPSLLTFAAQDYWHDVAARFPDDWPAMARQALALSPARVEDYVAALAGAGPLRSQ